MNCIGIAESFAMKSEKFLVSFGSVTFYFS